jgi:hypothetical protein
VAVRVRAGLGVAACSLAVPALALAGCGGESKTNNPTALPTVSMWVSATAKDYRQTAAGAKLALAERGGRSGVFRINYAGKQVSDDPARATADALANARTSLRDPQISGVVMGVGGTQARAAITLLNEAGIPTAAVGDAALHAEACSAGSNMYPSGNRTAIVVGGDGAKPSAAWKASFKERLGFAPSAAAWGSYQGARALLASLGAEGVVQPGSDPARLNRDALAAEMVAKHGGC